METEQRRLKQGVDKGIITQDQADKLWGIWQEEALVEPVSTERSSSMSQFLYYLGALIVIGAMSWLMNTAWEQFRGFGLLAIAAGYASVFCGMARYFRQKSTVLSGLFVVMAVCMTPLGVFGLQAGLNLWPYAEPGSYKSFYHYIRGGWFVMETATIATGIFSLRYSRIPFAMMPIAFTLWFMSMDITPILAGTDFNWDVRKQVSIVFGLLMLGIAFAVERRQQIDYAKWLYIFGAMTFWGGLSLLRSNSELSKFIYCLINVFMMFCGVLLNRKVFLVFGGVGFFGYLGYLSWNVFKNSIAFPFWLTVLGLAVVYLGWLYHKKYEAIQHLVRSITPQFILELLPKKRDIDKSIS
jgi:hypothetical protein